MFKLYYVAKGEIPDFLIKIINYGLNGYFLPLPLSFIYKFASFLFKPSVCYNVSFLKSQCYIFIGLYLPFFGSIKIYHKYFLFSIGTITKINHLFLYKREKAIIFHIFLFTKSFFS